MTEYLVGYEAGGSRFFLAEVEADLWGNIWSDTVSRAVRFPTAACALQAGRDAGVPELSVWEVTFVLKRVCGLAILESNRKGD